MATLWLSAPGLVSICVQACSTSGYTGLLNYFKLHLGLQEDVDAALCRNPSTMINALFGAFLWSLQIDQYLEE